MSGAYSSNKERPSFQVTKNRLCSREKEKEHWDSCKGARWQKRLDKPQSSQDLLGTGAKVTLQGKKGSPELPMAF